MNEYHCPNYCPKCGQDNEVTVTDRLEYVMCEARTTCRSCGHEDYWAYGFFENSECLPFGGRTYSFG